MPFYAKVILDSIGPQENRLTTMEFTIPKLWLAEFNTHCMFARNSASTRAIPYKKQRELMLSDTFVPFEWPLEGKGMAHSEVVMNKRDIEALEGEWIVARDRATNAADTLVGFGIHKQLSGRLLEPWRFQTVLVTGDAGSYANFFHLRRDKAAAPEIHRTANLMWEEYSKSVPRELKTGQWHMPLLQADETPWIRDFDVHESWMKVSAARCARLSYLTHHGKRDVKEDIVLFYRLIDNGHWSPLEHVCQATSKNRTPGFILKFLNAQPKKYGKWDGWKSLRSMFPNEYVTQYDGKEK